MKYAVIYTLFILTLTACSQDCAMTSKAQSQGNAPPECDIFWDAVDQHCIDSDIISKDCIKQFDEAVNKCNALLGVKRPAGIKSTCPQQTISI